MPGDPTELLSPVEYHVLMALADRERHAEEIPREVERLSMGSVTLRPVLLQVALKRLMRFGLVASSVHGDPDPADDHVHYRLTRAGEKRLSEETHPVVRALKADRFGAALRARRPATS